MVDMAITWQPYFLTLLLIDFALCAFIYLITWRIARRLAGGAGGGSGRRGGHWPAAGLLVSGEVPGMGRLRPGSHPSWRYPPPTSSWSSWGTG